MKRIFTVTLVFTIFQLLAQDHPSCDGERFRNDIFDNVSSTLALQYGQGITFAGNDQNLFLDVYEPIDDIAETRPAIILAFGGSFIGGTREDMAWLCEAYAKKGFVAVTIDYRLYDGPFFPLPSGEDMTDVVAKAVSDMKAAIRYLREDAATSNLYRIDPDNIFLGGISAGGITAAHAAVLDDTDEFTPELEAIFDGNGGIEGNSSDNLEYSSEVKGYINFSGALNDASWIDAEDPPFFSVHDDGDQTVPYGEGFASIFNFEIIYMEGSQIMHEQANELGIINELQTIENSNGHVSYFGNPTDINTYVNLSAEFLFNLICADWTSGIDDLSNDLDNLEIYPNPTDGLISIKNDNQLPLKITLFDVAGKKKFTWENTNQIDLSAYELGIYHLVLENIDTGNKKVEKIVLER